MSEDIYKPPQADLTAESAEDHTLASRMGKTWSFFGRQRHHNGRYRTSHVGNGWIRGGNGRRAAIFHLQYCYSRSRADDIFTSERKNFLFAMDKP